MAVTYRHLRGPLVAFAALLAASLASGEASACSMTEPARATACGCCAPASDEAPTTPTAVAEPAAMPRPLPDCQTTPGGGCSCRSRVPSAPAPQPSRGTAGGRAESDHVADIALPGDDRAVRIARSSSQLFLTQGPPKVPLYLRNERLLF
jgi:hypothetical protein